jgi:hypothetical protein
MEFILLFSSGAIFGILLFCIHVPSCVKKASKSNAEPSNEYSELIQEETMSDDEDHQISPDLPSYSELFKDN